jgi:hypothetical protein
MTQGVRRGGPSGPDLVEELRTAAAAAGVPLLQFVTPLVTSTPHNLINCLVKAKRPTPLTIARVRACVAGDPVPDALPSPFGRHYGGPARTVRADNAESLERRERKQALADHARAQRRPGETLADALRRIGREVDEEVAAENAADAEARRRRALADLASPSALIRRAERDWPLQSARVGALAAELGVARGEAWLQVIEAGIAALSTGGE